MKQLYLPVFIFCLILFASCAGTHSAYNPAKKFPRAELQKDYSLLRNILRDKHPSLYWYTDSLQMNNYFAKYYSAIDDSMTEQQFNWHVVAPLIDKIHCGHTSTRMSKAYGKWVNGKAIPSFPLFMKIWNDTMAVTGNLNFKTDSVFKRGTLVTGINGIPNKLLIKYMFEFLPEDGYANNVNYIRLSSNFPYYHRVVFGLNKTYTVSYLDSNNAEQKKEVPLFSPLQDTIKKKDRVRPVPQPKFPREKKILRARSLTIDGSGKYAVMTLNTFSEGKLRTFFRRSFRTMRRQNIQHLVLDIRTNGGGRVGSSTLLTKYVSRKPFRVADTLSTHAGGLGKYTRYVKGKFLNNIEMALISRKKSDGRYHIGTLEKKVYKTKKRNHFGGDLYVLTGGPTFSASTLFCNAVKSQPGITLLGEETGGGWYGNNGIMIPEITLPVTKLRVRLPLYRLVQFDHPGVKGTGVPPDVAVGPNYDALLKGYDKKMAVVREMIMTKN